MMTKQSPKKRIFLMPANWHAKVETGVWSGAKKPIFMKGAPSQCGNLGIFPTLRFFVKSILMNVDLHYLPFDFT